MTDDSTTTPDQDSLLEPPAPAGGSKTGGNPSPSPSWNATIGDPARRGFGDKPDDGSKRTDASKVDYKGVKANEPRTGGMGGGTAAEDDRGRQAVAAAVPADNRSKGGPGTPTGQPGQKSQPTAPSKPSEKAPHGNVPGSTGGDCDTSVKGAGAMPVRTPSDSSSTP